MVNPMGAGVYAPGTRSCARATVDHDNRASENRTRVLRHLINRGGRKPCARDWSGIRLACCKALRLSDDRQ
jgi:hypothetical protein